MNIGFVTDTNILKRNEKNLKKDSAFLEYMDVFTDYIESLEKTSCKDKLIYFMPDIIIEELYNQKLKAFQEEYDSWQKKFQEISYGLDGNIPKCKIEDVLKKEIGKAKEKVKILKLPYTGEMFKEITEDALKKNPPFDKSDQGKKSDSGYKDSLIWKTFIHSTEIDKCEKLYFFSADKVFINNKEYLLKEFNDLHPNISLEIVFFETNNQIGTNCLKKIIDDNHLIETEIIKLYNFDLMLENIRKIKYDYENEVSYYNGDEKIILDSVDFKLFSKDDFEINSVKECTITRRDNKNSDLKTKKEEKYNKKYEVSVLFNTYRYKIKNESGNNPSTSKDKNLNKDNANNSKENINKRQLKGKIKFIFEKNDEDFKLCEYNFVRVEFETAADEILKSFCNTFEQAIGDIMERTAVAFKNMEFAQELNNSMNTLQNIISNNNISNYPAIDNFNKLQNGIENMNSVALTAYDVNSNDECD